MRGRKRWRVRGPGGHERELEAELRFHFERTVEDLEAAGCSREEAEREAHRRFGDVGQYRRKLGRIDRGTARRRRWWRRLDAAEGAMRQAIRGIVRSPGLLAGVVLAFALGIGANATMFGIVDRLLLSPPSHVVEPDGVKRLVVDRYVPFLGTNVQGTSIAWADYRDFESVSQFEAVAAYLPRTVMVGRGESAERASAQFVSASWWPLLGVRPVVGRFFGPEEDRVGAEAVVVVGYRMWKRRFGGDASVLGRTLDYGFGPATIIGVAPKGFTGVDLGRVDIWAPIVPSGAKALGPEWVGDNRGMFWLRAVGRLAPGTSVAVAEAAATAAHRAGRAPTSGEGRYDPEARIVAAPLIVARAALQHLGDHEASGTFAGEAAAQEAKVALWLAGVSLVVLLIACVNVANLLLARAIRRRRETAIRVALGVSRGRLIAQTVAEGVLLAALGGAAALLVTRWGGDLVRGVLLPGVEFADSGLGTRVLPFVLAVSLLAGLIAAVVPAIEATRRELGDTIRLTAGGITRSTRRVRAALSMAQATLSVVLLVGAGLFLRSLRNLDALDLGFDADGLYVATLDVEGGSLTEAEKHVFYPEAAERLSSRRGVRSVSWSQGVPYYTSFATRVELPGRDSLPTPRSGGPYLNGVDLDYFRTLGLRVVRGRAFAPVDFASGLSVIVNQALARLWWPDEDALGQCMQIGEGEVRPCSTVVGVVEDARRGSIFEDPNPQYYVPNTSAAVDDFGEALFIRLAGDDAGIVPELRRTLLELSPRLRFVDIRPISDLSASETRAWKLGATMFTLFGGLALLVAALGLYSVLAFDVAQRTREIGLRNALGAGSGRILSGVVGRSVRIAVAGTALGVAIALLLAPRVEALLFDTSARDPVTLAIVTGVLLLTAVVAAAVPGWRA
ncbi:MAG: ADOP family duplicated permease, partial [Gemmatimonadota bacterium]